MTYQVAACQFEPAIDNPSENLETIRTLGSELADNVVLAIFPELCVSGYDLDIVAEQATAVPGPITEQLSAIASDIGCRIAVGLSERDDDELFNTTVVCSGSGVDAAYRKRHPWGVEADVFTPGTSPTVVHTSAGTVGLGCCYDLNFPEIGLEYALQGCDILAVNAAWRASYRSDWKLLSRARARDGPFYVVASNHAGDQRGRAHAGNSLIAGPDGGLRSVADETTTVVSAPVVPSELTRANERNPVRATRSERNAR